MADVWSDVVYTPKTNYQIPTADNKIAKTEQWAMPDTVPPTPANTTKQWEMPDPPAAPPDTTEVKGGKRIENTAQTPDNGKWVDNVLDFLNGLPKPQPKTEAKPEPKPAPKPEPKPIPAEGRTFKTQGDPLVRTGDGLWFGVHEPGRYVSLKSKSGDFMMEQEISKTRDGRKYNTAMGFKLDNNTIKIDTNDGNGPGTMTINGKKYDLKFAAHGITLPDGGKVTYDPKTNQVKISSADGDAITIKRYKNAKGVEYLNADVTLSAKRPSGSVHGLLGSLDADTNAQNDTRGRDGKAIAVNGTTTLNMNDARLWKTPEEFAKEWRSRPGESILA